jgi:hypothetical protein
MFSRPSGGERRRGRRDRGDDEREAGAPGFRQARRIPRPVVLGAWNDQLTPSSHEARQRLANWPGVVPSTSIDSRMSGELGDRPA